ncbi:hypothetical protein AB1Y20_018295 [Prymnesium parvum]|uniref:Protein phosphatase n=1 Tax=Prymnesium parvum TaxID=97485 RepID=A0AB34JMZ2_PRYPA
MLPRRVKGRPALALAPLARAFLTAAPTAGLTLQCAASVVPHPEKSARGGEDAMFADEDCGALGVADGVGGWASSGVDPGIFSRALLRGCHAGLSAHSHASQSEEPSLRRAVCAAAEALRQGREIEGTATLLLAQMAPSGVLQVMNVGDSALLTYRMTARESEGQRRLAPQLLLRTHEGTHGFNFPHQVSSSTLLEECARNALEFELLVRPGDVLVAVTDGVTDNVFESHIQAILTAHLEDILNTDTRRCARGLEGFASELARTANAIGIRQDDPSTRTPFSEQAKMYGFAMEGGKLDDVAVVCAVVRPSSAGRRPNSALLSNF